jgi:hypothetical protein
MKRKFYLSAFLILVSISSCDILDTSDVSGEWLIPKDEVFDGGPGRDGIPSIDNPQFTNVTNASYLNDNDLVIGLKIDGVIRAYPHPILDWHEIVNDELSGTKIALTYCPLTGSAIAWNRDGLAGGSTFGVSGLLFNSNLIPYDRGSQSNWSQMMVRSVNGNLIGKEIETTQVLETTYKTWREMYPGSKILSTNTGFSRSYGTYPYGGYRTNNDLLFPVNFEDNRLHKKARVLGLIAGEISIAYPISSFGNDVAVVNSDFGGLKHVVIASEGKNFAIAFNRKHDDGTVLEFTAVQNELPIVMTDNEGNKWDIFGEATDGPRKGTKLSLTKSFIAYWFAWAAFYSNTTIYQ